MPFGLMPNPHTRSILPIVILLLVFGAHVTSNNNQLTITIIGLQAIPCSYFFSSFFVFVWYWIFKTMKYNIDVSHRANKKIKAMSAFVIISCFGNTIFVCLLLLLFCASFSSISCFTAYHWVAESQHKNIPIPLLILLFVCMTCASSTPFAFHKKKITRRKQNTNSMQLIPIRHFSKTFIFKFVHLVSFYSFNWSIQLIDD